MTTGSPWEQQALDCLRDYSGVRGRLCDLFQSYRPDALQQMKQLLSEMRAIMMQVHTLFEHACRSGSPSRAMAKADQLAGLLLDLLRDEGDAASPHERAKTVARGGPWSSAWAVAEGELLRHMEAVKRAEAAQVEAPREERQVAKAESDSDDAFVGAAVLLARNEPGICSNYQLDQFCETHGVEVRKPSKNRKLIHSAQFEKALQRVKKGDDQAFGRLDKRMGKIREEKQPGVSAD